MDKQKLKTFAIESRRKLIEDVTYQANLLGVNADGISEPFETADGMQAFDIGAGKPYKIYDEDIKRRESLINEVTDKGFDNVMEEVAYTWFNRIIAIRYMELHNYLPTHVRVLSSEIEGKNEPDIITESPNIDLDFTQEDKELIYNLKDENSLEELFQFLFIKQCNKLNEILPGLFEKTEDYMELLLNLSYTSDEGVISHLIKDISIDDFEQEEIIGWLYQYYNAELKDEIFKELKKNVKITKENIPAATQLFTPDWIVKYMVENSLGKLWLEENPNENIEKGFKYYLKDAKQDSDVEKDLEIIKYKSKVSNPKDLKVLDPCMGSGHMLLYVFDVLIQIYESKGYTKKDAAILILENNIYGLDIDQRAYQLAYFALMMKAKSYNNKIFKLNINLNLTSIYESNNISQKFIDILSDNHPVLKNDLEYIKEVFTDAKDYGSILNLKKINITDILEQLNLFKNELNSNIGYLNLKQDYYLMKLLILQYTILCDKYDIVITNPPYMGSKSMNSNLINYIKNNYSDSKRDLFAVFMEKCLSLTKDNGLASLVTMQSWMFLSSYEKLRKKLLNQSFITNLLHMENMVMGIAFGTSATIFRKNNLVNFKGRYNQIKYKDINQKENIPLKFPIKENNNNLKTISDFKQIPGNPIAYWASKQIFYHFKYSPKLKDCIEYTGSFHKTANNDKFLRYFWEINWDGLSNWKHYNKGGKFRKWYGNNELLVKWTDDSVNYYKNHGTANLFKKYFWDKEGITWTALTNGMFNARFFEKGFISDFKGASLYPSVSLSYVLGFLNSVVFYHFIKFLASTMDYNIGQVISIPFLYEDNNFINELVEDNINISKNNWDMKELSFNFKINPLINSNKSNYLISNQISILKNQMNNDFDCLRVNEEKINKYFIDLYDLNNILQPSVEKKNISLYNFNLKDNIKELISYAVGCMFGRYNLDDDGLICTNNDFNLENYSIFVPDVDNIIPITDREYFDDDIVGRFVKFVRVTFGSEHLEENLDFIAGALKKSGSSSRDIIRNYFLKDFFDDHKKMYKKCPIYWLFDSGKQNGFKCLVYMHRYTPDLVARVRTDYLHKTQKAIESQIDYQEGVKEHSSNSKDKSRADKQVKLLTKQLNETSVYDEALAHVASQEIELDLDDGVKVNYAKFQGVEVSHEGQKTKKINLLKKL